MPADEVYELVLCSARAVFGEAGFDAVTIDRVAKAAGVTRQAVYEHFRGKEALFEAALRDSIAHYAARRGAADRELDTAAPDWPVHRCAALVEFSLEHPEHLRLMREGWRIGHPAVAETFEADVESNAAGLRAYWRSQYTELDSENCPQLTVRISAALLRAMLDQQWEGPPPSAEIFTEMLSAFILGGVGVLLKHGSSTLSRIS